MYTGGHAQMSSNNYSSQPANGLPMAPAGLSSRRGSQNIKPLSFDAVSHHTPHDNGAPTPRTSRSHLLAGLRTAPKSATATSFGPASPTAQQFTRNSMTANLHGYAHDNYYNAPKTAYPQYASQHQQQHQQQQQQPAYQSAMNQQYTVEQVLAPPELSMEEQVQDPNLYAQLVATNMYLAQRQQLLQQQLRNVQAAAAQHAAQHQFQNLSINSPQQHLPSFEQQQQLQQQQLQAAVTHGQQIYFNHATGQYFVDTSAAAQSPMHYRDSSTSSFNSLQQLQLQLQQHQQQQSLPRVQVSPPPEIQRNSLRSVSPPKRFDSPSDTVPLPPPSANAFRRGHKKASSLAPVNSILASALASDGPKSAGPKTASFPITPLTGGYGPGQARAGEHPVRQPRGPPSLDELKARPTAKHEGSKNFATRTRRSAVHNLVRAGMSRRKGTGSSSGSMSPVSETAEDSNSPITDNDSDSGRSGSGSLAGEEECTSSRTSASGGWGAIGSDRPGSRQMTRKGDSSDATGSFANVFKKDLDAVDLQRKAPRMVLTSVEKRKATPVV
ncbi:uncharacterized protein BBA_03314 [Beauveria bassiana ARSEF 2860]|uniref:Uncharacterized protein n=1 Tax=Beauveria bassiana (strain ARSEF 2860) TaxID=655819 RepID=J4KPI9_BEAB2|nr:uncharacterized protein BBA_03314 [Beauveria bassiana ARSEF 2860]EJP67534.1 hypothetical protein BBA_03314 [Beauveria bassiana ARSEF 2860]